MFSAVVIFYIPLIKSREPLTCGNCRFYSLTYKKYLFIKVEMLFIKIIIKFIYSGLIRFIFVYEVNIYCYFFV